jgi:hypothetical protein
VNDAGREFIELLRTTARLGAYRSVLAEVAALAQHAPGLGGSSCGFGWWEWCAGWVVRPGEGLGALGVLPDGLPSAPAGAGG